MQQQLHLAEQMHFLLPGTAPLMRGVINQENFNAHIEPAGKWE